MRIAIDRSGQLTRWAFRQVCAVGLADVKAVGKMETEALLDFACFVVHVLDGVRGQDLDPVLTLAYLSPFTTPVGERGDKRCCRPLQEDRDCVVR